jgi:uncharacterized RDD family membrane protein YckC
VAEQTDVDQRIVTGEAVAVDLRTAGVGSRGVALVVDFTLQFVLILALVYVIDQLGSSLENAAAAALVLSLFVLVVLGYPVGFESLWHGRTPGKAVMGLRVTRDDGGPIRFRHAFVRGLVGVVVDRLGLSIGLLALVPMLATQRSKRLGDLAAGTIVVQERVPSRQGAPRTVAPELAGWAAGLDLSGVSDGLAAEIRQFLARARQLASWAREDMGDRLLAEVSRTVGPPPPGMAPGAFLETVLAERSRREALRLTGGATPVTTPSHEFAAPPPPTEPAQPAPPGPFAPPA